MISSNQYILLNNTNNHNIRSDYEHEYFLSRIIQCKTKNISNGPHNEDKYKQNKHEI